MKLQDVTFPDIVAAHRSAELDDIATWAESRELPAPVHVEIGSNRGKFLKGLAASLPDRTLLGIEIRRKFAEVLHGELVAEGLQNAHVLGADAQLALPLLFPNASIECVYLLFPDPWWKKRHAKRRLFTPPVLDLLADKLQVGGHLVVKTDVEPYAEMIEEVLPCTQRFDRVEPGDAGWPPHAEAWPLTTRERKVTRAGGPIWRFVLRRNDAPRSTEPYPEIDMQRFPKPGGDDENAPARRPRHRG